MEVAPRLLGRWQRIGEQGLQVVENRQPGRLSQNGDHTAATVEQIDSRDHAKVPIGKEMNAPALPQKEQHGRNQQRLLVGAVVEHEDERITLRPDVLETAQPAYTAPADQYHAADQHPVQECKLGQWTGEDSGNARRLDP